MKLRMVTVGAAALVVAGVTTGLASPAQAQGGEADLALTVDGTTIAQGAGGKFGRVETVNHGPDAATGIVWTYDISGLDTSKVRFALDECGDPVGDVLECVIDPDRIEKDGRITFFDPFEEVDGAVPGPAGSITVSVTHDGTDPDPDNNTVTAEVSIKEQGGVDLTVWAPDISEEWIIKDRVPELAGELLPGSETSVFVFIDNQGTVPTRGVEVSITLPEHVTFSEEFPECSHQVGDSSTTCQVPSLTLNPNTDDEFCYSPTQDEVPDESCVVFFLPVKVDDDAPESAKLSGGVAEAWDMQVDFAPFAASTSNLLLDPGKAPELLDVDPTDNVDNFSFFTSSLGDGGAGGDDGGAGGGDKLPVTGTPVVLITGLGAALLVAGVVLYLASRRRRMNVTASDG
ncbi:MAG: LPXTG cell wall anchor domain-containing protein [Micromonosporaceae bacterium]|jgi:LPXTG-motif cell wall-anchored protein